MTTTQLRVSKARHIAIYVLTFLIGYLCFIIPDVFFGVTKLNGGKQGINLAIIGLVQCLLIIGLLNISLKSLRLSWHDIGAKFNHVSKDLMLGIAAGGAWLLLQFLWIIPATGGVERLDIQYMIDHYDGSLIGLISFIIWGVVGGGIAEELFNRGFVIKGMQRLFHDQRFGLWVASIFSIIIFALGHLPTGVIYWFDILVPTIMYTLLFVKTGRLLPSMAAHGLYNAGAIVWAYYTYY